VRLVILWLPLPAQTVRHLAMPDHRLMEECLDRLVLHLLRDNKTIDAHTRGGLQYCTTLLRQSDVVVRGYKPRPHGKPPLGHVVQAAF